MLTPRNIILFSITICAISLLWMVYDATRTPDSGGIGRDSYGTRAPGQRGLFETLRELDVPVTRQLAPPSADLEDAGLYVLWGPDLMLVATEPTYLTGLFAWVERGGQVVVAPSLDDPDELMIADDEMADMFNANVLFWLGIEDVTTDLIDFDPGTTESGRPSVSLSPWRPVIDPIADTLAELTVERLVVPVDVDERLTESVGDFQELAVPRRRMRILTSFNDDLTPAIVIHDDSGQEHVVLGWLEHGEGDVFVVSDPRLFSNVALGEADNSVLAVRLLAGSGETVVFDEFYHGLSVRGNPFYVASRPQYAAITLAILLVIGVYTWRQAVLLGPPLTTPVASRRALGEYLDAMSRLFERGRRTRHFLLSEVWRGVLRQLQREFRMTATKPDVDRIAAAIQRRDPDRAERFLESARVVDEALAKGDNCGRNETLTAIQRITACLGSVPQ